VSAGKVDVLAVMRQEIRAAGFVVTPYRLGRKAGEAGVEHPCPYFYPRSVNCWRAGFAVGYRDFIKAQREAAALARIGGAP
jgi:hypothetical protein